MYDPATTPKLPKVRNGEDDDLLYGVAIQDVFDRWIRPLGAIRGRKHARDYAHFLRVEGYSNHHGEIKNVRVVLWT